MTNAKFVSAGKPKIGGAIRKAPIGTVLPTNAKETLNVAFKSLGYLGEDGLKNKNTAETDNTKSWGGDTVLTLQKSKSDTFSFSLLECLNPEVLKVIYTDGNVSGTIETGITVKANAKENSSFAWVVDMVMKDGVLKRIVIPNASITEIGEVTYKDSEAVKYEVTLTATPDAEGNTHYEYIQKGA